jgi:hypothetical protein
MHGFRPNRPLAPNSPPYRPRGPADGPSSHSSAPTMSTNPLPRPHPPLFLGHVHYSSSSATIQPGTVTSKSRPTGLAVAVKSGRAYIADNPPLGPTAPSRATLVRHDRFMSPTVLSHQRWPPISRPPSLFVRTIDSSLNRQSFPFSFLVSLMTKGLPALRQLKSFKSIAAETAQRKTTLPPLPPTSTIGRRSGKQLHDPGHHTSPSRRTRTTTLPPLPMNTELHHAACAGYSPQVPPYPPNKPMISFDWLTSDHCKTYNPERAALQPRSLTWQPSLSPLRHISSTLQYHPLTTSSPPPHSKQH